jgi:hypothetical protein
LRRRSFSAILLQTSIVVHCEKARPRKPPEARRLACCPRFCRGRRGVTRRYKGVALPTIFHVLCLGAFLKQALESVLIPASGDPQMW